MGDRPMIKPAEIIPLCELCHEDIGTREDREIGATVCEECLTRLRWGQARLKASGIISCRPVISNRLKGLGLV